MLRFTSSYKRGNNEFNTIFTVWELEEHPSGKSMNLVLNTSREANESYGPDKQKIEDGLTNEYNGKNYVRSKFSANFVQGAFNTAKKYGVTNGSRITNVVGELTCETYIITTKDENGNSIPLLDNEGKPVRRYGAPFIKVLDFDVYESNYNNNNANNMDTPPKVELQDKDECPF